MTGRVHDILIECSPGETRAAMLDEDGALLELLIDRLGELSLVGTICRGRVTRLEKATQGAFVNVGLAGPAFLPRAKGLTEGQNLIVQVTRDGWGEKGPAVGRSVALSGRYLVYRPGETTVRWPRSISNRVKTELEPAVRSAVREGEGVTVRRNAVLAEPEDLAAEAETLRRRWQEIEAMADAPGVLQPAAGLVDRILRDYAPMGDIILDDRRQVADAAAKAAPDLADKIAFHDEAAPLFETFGVEEQIDEALSRTVALPRGGTAIIDEVEALTAIDVNMGSAGGSRRGEDAVLSVNRTAAEIVARQIMLRNIAGLIVIDFVTMRSKANNRKLVESVRRAFARDRVTVDILGMTSAGLVEVTRQRRGVALSGLMQEAKRTEASLRPGAHACAALRAVLRQLGAGRPVLRCAPGVATVLEGPLKTALDETTRRLGQPLEVRADPACVGFEVLREGRS